MQQVGDAIQGERTIRRGKRPNVLAAIVAVVVAAALLALMMWVVPLAPSGVGTQDVNLDKAGAGSAVIHDDAGNVNR